MFWLFQILCISIWILESVCQFLWRRVLGFLLGFHVTCKSIWGIIVPKGIESSNPGTLCVSPFGSYLISQLYFVVFSVQVFLIFCHMYHIFGTMLHGIWGILLNHFYFNIWMFLIYRILFVFYTDLVSCSRDKLRY